MKTHSTADKSSSQERPTNTTKHQRRNILQKLQAITGTTKPTTTTHLKPDRKNSISFFPGSSLPPQLSTAGNVSAILGNSTRGTPAYDDSRKQTLPSNSIKRKPSITNRTMTFNSSGNKVDTVEDNSFNTQLKILSRLEGEGEFIIRNQDKLIIVVEFKLELIITR